MELAMKLSMQAEGDEEEEKKEEDVQASDEVKLIEVPLVEI